MALTCEGRCLHATTPASRCRCSVCQGAAHGLRPQQPIEEAWLFTGDEPEVSSSAPAVSAGGEEKPTPPRDGTTDVRSAPARRCACGRVAMFGSIRCSTCEPWRTAAELRWGRR